MSIVKIEKEKALKTESLLYAIIIGSILNVGVRNHSNIFLHKKWTQK